MKKISIFIMSVVVIGAIAACDGGGSAPPSFDMTIINSSATKNVLITDATLDTFILIAPSGGILPYQKLDALQNFPVFNQSPGTFTTGWSVDVDYSDADPDTWVYSGSTNCEDVSNLEAGKKYILTFKPDTIGDDCDYDLVEE